MPKIRSDIFHSVFEESSNYFIEGEIRKRILDRINDLDINFSAHIHLEHPEDEAHGDYATNISFKLSGLLKTSPQEIGSQLAGELSKDDYFERVEFAPPGFINFFLAKHVLVSVIEKVNSEGVEFGKTKIGQGKKIQFEFISANPTGPLTFPNARGGFTGDTLATVFEELGFDVNREYYVNDYGNQVNRLGGSVYHEYMLLKGEKSTEPEEGYKGGYIKDIAAVLFQENKDYSLQEVTHKALEFNISSAKETVERMGIHFDEWFSEKSLHDIGSVDDILKKLEKEGKTYEKDGAVWLKTTDFGDDKDRVLVKSSGEKTYIMGDLAYHVNKLHKRQNDYVVNVWGADHHGDVARLRAGLHFLGFDHERVDIVLIALMKMKREGKEVKISKRAGTYVLMNDVLDEVPLDVLRFFAQMYDVNSPMTFDLDLALDTSERNPVYYVQYAHARMASIIKKAPEDALNSEVNLGVLTFEELAIVKKLIIFPELIVDVAKNREVHHLPHYAVGLAKAFHNFYHHYQVISDDIEVTKARLAIVRAVKTVLKNTLTIIGVSAPEKM